MSVEFYRESPGKFDSMNLNMKTLNRWTGRIISPFVKLLILLWFIACVFAAYACFMCLFCCFVRGLTIGGVCTFSLFFPDPC